MATMKQQGAQNLFQAGTVVAVHADQTRVRVRLLGKTSGWLPVLQQANAFKRRFIAPRLAEQVLVLGKMYVLRGLYHQQLPAPNGVGSQVDISEYEDGTRIEYDSRAKKLTIKAIGEVELTAERVTVNGAAGDVTVNGISLVNHTHPQNSGNHYGGGVNTGAAE